MPRMKQMLNFKTNVLLKSIIGKDLINNDNIAVLELVKNSFDAQAKRVDIVFENIQTTDLKNSRLIIEDDGTGMSLEDIKNKWLNIAFSEKKKESKKHGRMMAGAKGVGRFSCDRLGERLNLYTRSKGKQILLLEVEWSDFEIEDEHELEIQQIPITCRTVTDKEFKNVFGRDMPHGTLLEIGRLRSPWTKPRPRKGGWSTEQLQSLRRDLEKLASPSAAFNKKTFLMELHVPEFTGSDQLADEHKKINGIIENKIFEKLPYTTTVIQTEVNDRNELVTTLTDKNRQIVKIREKNKLSNLDGLRITIYYLNSYAKAYFRKQTGIRSVDYGSIFLFLNGFRVRGLGDYGNDWLRMEVRKSQGYARFLGTREVVGRIEIVDPKQAVQIVSSREGIVTNDLTRQIVDHSIAKYDGLFYKTLRRLERYVVFGLEWDKTTETQAEIDNRIHNSNNWEYNPIAEKYKKTQTEKDRNLLQIIQPIVEQESRPEDIVDVDINLELLADVKDEADKKTQEKFKRFVEKHHIDISQLEEVKQAQLETKQLEEELGEKERLLLRTREEKEKALQEMRREKVARRKVEQGLSESKQKVASLEQVNYFQEQQIDRLDSFTKADVTTLVGYLHHIGIYSAAIETNMRNIGTAFQALPKEIKEIFTDIDFDAKKISVLSRLGQKAFEELDESVELDLIGYASQYVRDILKGTISNIAAINVKNNSGKESFFVMANPTDISVIIDNLLDNSAKANATWASIVFETIENSLNMRYRDNGDGLNPNISAPEKIFELGYSTTVGSGVGLNHVARIVKEIGGRAQVDLATEEGFTLNFFFEGHS